MKNGLTPRAILIVLLTLAIVAFAVMNYGEFARVWPFGSIRTIYLIVGSLAVGAGVGALGVGLIGSLRNARGLSATRQREVVGDPMAIQAGERPRAGRP